jgi:hypothetical protein
MSSAAAEARNKMVGRITPGPVYRTDDASGDYHLMIEAEIIKVNPSLPTIQVRSMANRIALQVARMVDEQRARWIANFS